MRQQRLAGKTPTGAALNGDILRKLIASGDVIWAEEDRDLPEITYQHTVICQASLPYANPGDGIRRWQRGQGTVRLEVEAGRA